MIRRLRVRHRRTFGVLAVLLPVGLFAAVAARPEYPVSATSVDDLLGRAGEAAPGTARVLRADGRAWIEVRPASDPRLPDVLVYLSRDPVESGSLPDDAVLLGVLSGADARRLPLPDGTDPAGARLVFYSLGHDAVVGEMEL